MKAILISFACALACPMLGQQNDASHREDVRAADSDWQEVENVWKEYNEHVRPIQNDFLAYLPRKEELFLRYRELGLRFSKTHPNDGRRWDWFVRTLNNATHYYRDPAHAAVLIKAKLRDKIEIDEQARAAWHQEYQRLVEESRLDDGVTVAQRVSFRYWAWRYNRFFFELNAMKAGRPYDLRGLLEELISVSNEAGTADDAETRSSPVDMVGQLLENWPLEMTQRNALLAEIATTTNADVRKFAQEQLALGSDKPIELRFIGINGQSFDLAESRGQVVLIYFWATWCAPCLAKLPELKSLEQQYGNKQLRIVSVLLDDDPKAERKLRELIKRHEIAWPTYFDPVHVNGKIGSFGIKYAGSSFILDRKGVLTKRGVLQTAELKAEIQRRLRD